MIFINIFAKYQVDQMNRILNIISLILILGILRMTS
jgi:hypothetical protein